MIFDYFFNFNPIMAAPLGNQFWKLRSKHGVDALFTDPNKLWESAVEYFEYTDKRKLTRKDWVGKDADLVEREYDVPYTVHGLCIYLGCEVAWWRSFKGTETFKEKDFGTVYNRIDQIIYSQKFDGAAAGLFNANIIARDLGLRDTKEVGNIPGESFNVTLKLG